MLALGAKLFQSVSYSFSPTPRGVNSLVAPVSVPGWKRFPSPDSPNKPAKLTFAKLSFSETTGCCGSQRTPKFSVTLGRRSEEHTSELQSRLHLVCRLLLEKKKKKTKTTASLLC